MYYIHYLRTPRGGTGAAVFRWGKNDNLFNMSYMHMYPYHYRTVKVVLSLNRYIIVPKIGLQVN